MFAQVELRRHAGVLVEVDANHRERVFGERLPARRVALHVLVDAPEQAAVATPCIHDERRLRHEVPSREEGVDVPHEVSEERLVLRPAAHHIQRPVDVNFLLLRVLAGADEPPTRVLEEDAVVLVQQGGVGRRDVVGVATLQGKRAICGQGNAALTVYRAHAQLAEDAPESCPSRGVGLAEVEAVQGALLAGIQPILVPPRKVCDGGQQRDENGPVEQEGQPLAGRPSPSVPVLSPNPQAVRGLR
mmetsp:Transcript_68927/g.191923  ORF Transcript_68927/g.191923 Transcript_68927/m.191923 type:complete len:245 (+) Transcript_68927:702-1436(+)